MNDDAGLDGWLDTLAGRANDANDANDARVLRAALLARPAIDAVALQREIGREDDARAGQLLMRARVDDVLGPALARPVPARPLEAARPGIARTSRRGLAAALLAASIAGMAVALVWTLRPVGDTTAYRDAPDAVYRLTLAEPRVVRDQIVAALRAAGVAASTYERFGREGIDADLPRPLTPAVRAVLTKFGIPEPQDGVLRIEIEATVPR